MSKKEKKIKIKKKKRKRKKRKEGNRLQKALKKLKEFKLND